MRVKLIAVAERKFKRAFCAGVLRSRSPVPPSASCRRTCHARGIPARRARGGSTLRRTPDYGLGWRGAARAGAGHVPQDGGWGEGREQGEQDSYAAVRARTPGRQPEYAVCRLAHGRTG
jgi:hypothetical protein